jgi:hypothetical protein
MIHKLRLLAEEAHRRGVVVGGMLHAGDSE